MSESFLPARWKELRPLLDAALELPLDERPAFIERSCAGDAALRAELETLVAECAQPDGLFARNAVERFGALLASTPGQPPAMVAGRYRIDRELGAGGMATVYLAHDVKHDRDVALKVLRADLAAVVGSERFLAEVRITAKLDHPHILTLIDSGSDAGMLFYVLPYVRGETLRAKLLRESHLSIDEALSITRQIAAALDYAHAQGVIHRDIKPENILLHEGEAVLADFGIALAVTEAGGARLTQTGLSLGTPQYMSPEQATGDRALDARSDIYSLAAVLYEMIAGEPPFSGATKQAIVAKLLAERPTRLRVVRDTVPDGLDQAVLRALSKVPADRFATAGAFVRALDAGVTSDANTGAPSNVKARILLVTGIATVVALIVLAARLANSTLGGGNSARATLVDRKQITFSGRVSIPAISGDGKFLAYRTTTCDAHGCLYGIELKDVEGTATQRILDGASSIYTIEWSPDRRHLVFRGSPHAAYGTYVISVLGGAIKRAPLQPHFFADGDSMLFLRAGGLDRAPSVLLVAGPDWVAHDSIRIAGRGDQIVFATAVPGSKWIAIGLHRQVSTSLAAPMEARIIDRHGRVMSTIEVGLRGSRDTESHLSSDAVWISPGGEGWAKRVVMRIPFDPASGLFAGTIDTISTGVHTRFGITTDGKNLVIDEGSTRFSLWALTVADAVHGVFPPQRELLRSTSELTVQLSPDGKQVLVERDVGRAADGRPDWSTIPFDGPPGAETPRALGERTTAAAWSDSTTVAIRSLTDSGTRLALIDLESGALHDALASDRPRNFAHLPTGGWFWVRGFRTELTFRTPRDSMPRRIGLPAWYSTTQTAELSADGRHVAFSGHNAPDADSVGVSVFSLSDSVTTRWFATAADDGDVMWLNDGTLLLRLADTPETYSLYHLLGPGHAIKLGTIPRTVSSISVSRDLKQAAFVVHDYRGDAWISRVVRR